MRDKRVRYVAWGALLVFLIDFGTAGSFQLSYFKHGPLLLVFYLAYPLIFSYLIFARKWSGWKLFGATVAVLFIVEGILVRNPFVLSFPLLIIGIPLAISIYAPLTYFPLWIVNGELGRHKKAVVILSAVVVVTTALSVVTHW